MNFDKIVLGPFNCYFVVRWSFRILFSVYIYFTFLSLSLYLCRLGAGLTDSPICLNYIYYSGANNGKL